MGALINYYTINYTLTLSRRVLEPPALAAPLTRY